MEPKPNNRPEDQRQDGASVSDERAGKLVEQLRSTPAEQIIADVFSTLLTTADVKLGRRDARLFINLCATMLEDAGRYVSEELGKQVETALGQLRFAQVNAENRMAEKGEAEPNDLTRIPTPATTGGRTGAPTDQTAAPPSSKLWVPGR